jgi:hypothetical protein
MLSVGRESAAKYAGSSLSLDFKGTVWRTEPQIGQRSGWDQFSRHADQHADLVDCEFVIFSGSTPPKRTLDIFATRTTRLCEHEHDNPEVSLLLLYVPRWWR